MTLEPMSFTNFWVLSLEVLFKPSSTATLLLLCEPFSLQFGVQEVKILPWGAEMASLTWPLNNLPFALPSKSLELLL